MSQQSISTRKPQIYFITSNKKTEGYCSIDMLCVFNKCLERGIKPIWIRKQDSDKIKFMKCDILVVEKYERIAMNKLIKSECCIIEPEHFSFIINATPMCKRIMKDICICASHLCLEDKRYLQILVLRMSGNFTTKLDDKVTHLVTSSVLSAEYEKASHMQIQIVTKEWVKAVWDANMINYVKPDDERFNKYKVPMFYNLVITTTNIQRYQKEEVQHLIEDNGGVYMDALICGKVNIVLTPENSHTNQKLNCARETNTICLTLNWLYESIKAGHALPSRNYIFQTKEDYSERRSNVCETPSYSTTSSITYDEQQDNYMDETAFIISTMSNVPTFSTVTTALNRPAFNETELAGPFLYGCIIYLAGFTPDQRDRLNRILHVGSAMRLDYVCDIITHVIVGDEDSAVSELKLLKLGPLCPYILRLEWLEESIRLKHAAPEKDFLYEPSSSLIMNLQLLQERMLKEEEESLNFDQKELQNALVSTTEEPYIPTLNQISRDLEENFIPPETNNSGIINDKLFEGLTFVVFGFNDTYNCVVKNIVAMSGRIVPGTFVDFAIPDYAIVPKCGMPLKCIVKEIVTDLFIVDCINQDRIVEIMYYHRPICVTKYILSGCILTISSYIGVERSYLITLAVELGAICQDTFSRENIYDRDLYRNTHLLCPLPEGRKYDAALKWNIPVVTAEWLVACAAQSTWLDETPFLVIKSLGLNRRLGLNISLLQTNTNQIVLSTEPVPSSSRSHNVIVPEEYFPNLEVQNNNPGNILLLNNEFSLPYTNTTSELSGTYSQAYGHIPSIEIERSQLEEISYPLNLKKEPPSEV